MEKQNFMVVCFVYVRSAVNFQTVEAFFDRCEDCGTRNVTFVYFPEGAMLGAHAVRSAI